MSNKCRGTYTIKGEGTEALVTELNKYVKLYEEPLRADGGMVTCASVDFTAMLGPKWAGRTVCGGMRPGPDGKLIEFQIPETVYFDGYGDDWPLVIKDGKVTFWAETRWAPPVDALTILSELYPVEIELSYSLESDNWMNGRTLRFHQGKISQVRYGDFVLAEHGQSIHHWIVECEPKAVNLIKEAGVKLLGHDGKEPPPDKVTFVRVRDGDIATVKGITGGSDCQAYTLDEERYILSVQTDLDWGSPRHPHGRDIEIVERPIALLPEEVSTLYGKLVDLARTQRKPGQPPMGEATTEIPVTEVELARFGQFYGDICTCNKELKPTAREINLLRGAVRAERWSELEEALGKPAWTERWPDWEESKWEWVRRSESVAPAE